MEENKKVYVDGNIIITCGFYKCADLVAQCPKDDTIKYDDEKIGNWIVYKENMMDENTIYYASKNIAEIKPFVPSSIDDIYDLYKCSVDELKKLLEYSFNEEDVSYTRYKCAYSGIFSVMEFFIYNVCRLYILQSKEYTIKFLGTKFNDRKINIGYFFEKYENVWKYVEERLGDIIYHNVDNVYILFKEVFDINIDISEINQFTDIRHDIVHRDGRTKDGCLQYVTKGLLYDLIKCTDKIAAQIYNGLKDKEYCDI